MISFIKKVVRKVIGKRTSISMKGTNPMELTNTQQMFLRWNAERLNISFQESQKRYYASWSSIRGGHAGPDYRSFNDVTYKLLQVFFNDSEEEVYTSYESHGPMHFLRMLSYPEFQWNDNDIIVQHLSNYSNVNIVDYGCGLAQRSRSLAKYLDGKGITTELILIDIPTIRKEFLLWLGKQTKIKTTFLGSTINLPIPNLPKCDICFATEFFEHVYEPIKYFNYIHSSLNNNGLLVTNVSDHGREFMHVSPNLHTLREKIQYFNYEEILSNKIYKKIDNDNSANPIVP